MATMETSFLKAATKTRHCNNIIKTHIGNVENSNSIQTGNEDTGPNTITKDNILQMNTPTESRITCLPQSVEQLCITIGQKEDICSTAADPRPKRSPGIGDAASNLSDSCWFFYSPYTGTPTTLMLILLKNEG
ncbi:OLC1v1030312C1 [Oldenlandia corymbosa var. corymbosa]|uniref:OLC1v1030312C1 n=1 Tax=Oldenlandia corymbosa var. corymbosa TaxID=529605 RepID=A0AAV1CGJ4_OLDCO|nr:OLC1v1030312C1 [Oldenlandia corymbosa var. corymbosa]